MFPHCFTRVSQPQVSHGKWQCRTKVTIYCLFAPASSRSRFSNRLILGGRRCQDVLILTGSSTLAAACAASRPSRDTARSCVPPVRRAASDSFGLGRPGPAQRNFLQKRKVHILFSGPLKVWRCACKPEGSGLAVRTPRSTHRGSCAAPSGLDRRSGRPRRNRVHPA